MLKSHSRFVPFLLAALAAFTLAGCGGGAGKTPKQVAKRFCELLAAGKPEKAADLFAWDYIAEKQNPDWPDFGASQRKLIINKLKEQKATELKSIGISQADIKVGGEQIQGDQAMVTLTADSLQLTITLVKTKQGWRVLQVR